jgi:phosphohistidine swiveling domain-containing protein
MGDVLALDDDRVDIATAGGKAASLSRLIRAGLPVPPGFVVLAGEDALDAVREAYRGGPVAVRSSATSEDLTGMSSAGQHDSFLWVRGADAVVDAVRACRASLDTDRAVAYRERHDVRGARIAVVVQEMVDADAAGVLFTANPLTGDRAQTVVNAAWGLGEAVVGGQVTADFHVLDAEGREVGGHVADKAVMTVRVDGGTALAPVPQERRRVPVLSAEDLAELAALGRRAQEVIGEPVDVEWARAGGTFALLQARPITGLGEVWNDSLLGDYLWTDGNVGEAVPSVTTPATWSLVSALAMPPIDGHPVAGNIGGRFYLNLSLYHAVGAAFGLREAVARMTAEVFGRVPDGVEVPPVPLSRMAVLRAVVRFARQGAAHRKRMAAAVAGAPARCADLHARIAEADLAGIRALWTSELEELLTLTAPTLDAGARMGGPGRARKVLRELVGEDEATTLLTGLHGGGGELASLGPLVGLAGLRAGEIGRDEHTAAWGHRCPDEFELAAPRPAEDPGWPENAPDPGDPGALLARQARARDAAWRRLEQRHPGKARKVRALLAAAAASGRLRELARSELIRVVGVLRAFLLRVRELTGHDVFFLTFAEVAALLAGDDSATSAVPARRAAYDRYRALPPYPSLIRGRFDPFDQRPAGDGAITGFPGVAGVVEGLVRVVATPVDGEALRQGEILVARSTNVGWTPLFPRAAAVVTDIGAPLSHAAIVARELGIPAVVGCGDATARLATGDRVVVDGARGMVTPVGRG